MTEDGERSPRIRPFLLFFFTNFSISPCQLWRVTSGATTSAGRARLSVDRYASVCTVLPRPISSARSALPDDFIRKSSPCRWKSSSLPRNCAPGLARSSPAVLPARSTRIGAGLEARRLQIDLDMTSTG